MNIPPDVLTWPHIALAVGILSTVAVYGVGLWWTGRKS